MWGDLEDESCWWGWDPSHPGPWPRCLRRPDGVEAGRDRGGPCEGRQDRRGRPLGGAGRGRGAGRGAGPKAGRARRPHDGVRHRAAVSGGAWVAAGTVVVRLDDAAVRAAVAAAEAGLRAAESDLERTKVLVENGIVATRELEHVSAAASGARAQLTAARDSLSYTALRAPFAGRVAARHVDLGDVVCPAAVHRDRGRGRAGAPRHGRAGDRRDVAPRHELKAWWTASPPPRRRADRVPFGRPTTHRFELSATLPAVPACARGCSLECWSPRLGEPRLSVSATALLRRGGLTGLFVVPTARRASAG